MCLLENKVYVSTKLRLSLSALLQNVFYNKREKEIRNPEIRNPSAGFVRSMRSCTRGGRTRQNRRPVLQVVPTCHVWHTVQNGGMTQLWGMRRHRDSVVLYCGERRVAFGDPEFVTYSNYLIVFRCFNEVKMCVTLFGGWVAYLPFWVKSRSRFGFSQDRFYQGLLLDQQCSTT